MGFLSRLFRTRTKWTDVQTEQVHADTFDDTAYVPQQKIAEQKPLSDEPSPFLDNEHPVTDDPTRPF